MKRPVVVLMAVALAFSLSSVLLAGQSEKQRPKKKTVTGTIVKVNAKRHTIAVKPATGQQIQTQKSRQKEGEKPKKKNRPLVIHVDAKTKITSRVSQQQTAKGGAKSRQDESKFKVLRAGQLVRVVYQKKVVETLEQKPKSEQQQDADQEQKVKPKPHQGQKEKPKPDQEQKVKPKPDQKRKRVLRAIKIEILKQSAEQQQQQAPGQDR